VKAGIEWVTQAQFKFIETTLSQNGLNESYVGPEQVPIKKGGDVSVVHGQ